MEAKFYLRNRGDGDYFLEARTDNSASVVASFNPDDFTEQKLSLKNCQAIENGYNLDELAEIEYPICEVWNEEDSFIRKLAFKKGFQKALELMSDKKFSEDDMRKAYQKGEEDSYTQGGLTKQKEDRYIHSLQQTEWDVEIEMEEIYYVTKDAVNGKLNGSPTHRPKLDENGCLILKRKQHENI